MIYIARFILWFIIIVFISWMVHRFVGEAISNKKVKPFIGIIAFLVIILTPVTIAKVVQVYYCWKYQPFYEIIEPLGDDFEGYYGNGRIIDLIKKYPNIKYVDKKVDLDRAGAKDELAKINQYLIQDSKERFLYIREYIDDNTSQYCIFPTENYFKYRDRFFEKLEKEKDMFKDVYEKRHIASSIKNYEEKDKFIASGKCVARKIIPESKVSKYVLGRSTLKDKIIFVIPGIVKASYYKSTIFEDRKTGKYFAWGAGVRVEWDLYGVLGKEGMKKYFSCSAGINIKEKMIKQLDEKYGN